MTKKDKEEEDDEPEKELFIARSNKLSASAYVKLPSKNTSTINATGASSSSSSSKANNKVVNKIVKKTMMKKKQKLQLFEEDDLLADEDD